MAYVVIAVLFGISGGIVGRAKGSSFFIWFLISLCVPFIGLATALLYRSDHDELRRQCPGCGRVVKLHDAICTGCGTELDFPAVAIAPVSRGATARVDRAAASGNPPRSGENRW